jgi:hypothetical protein
VAGEGGKLRLYWRLKSPEDRLIFRKRQAMDKDQVESPETTDLRGMVLDRIAMLCRFISGSGYISR